MEIITLITLRFLDPFWKTDVALPPKFNRSQWKTLIQRRDLDWLEFLRPEIKNNEPIFLFDDKTAIEDNWENLQSGDVVNVLFGETDRSLIDAFFTLKDRADERKLRNAEATIEAQKNGIKIAEALFAMFRTSSTGSLAQEKKNDKWWFEGISTHENVTKDWYLAQKIQQRCRSYAYRLRKSVNHKINKMKEAGLEFLSEPEDFTDMFSVLRDSFSKGFAAITSPISEFRLCALDGMVSCGGPQGKSKCQMYHMINPLLSKEGRELLSAWELDHKIDISTIAKNLIEANEWRKRVAKDFSKKGWEVPEINAGYIFDMLYTYHNLSFVIGACHNKEPHGLSLDKRKMFIWSRHGLSEDELDEALASLDLTFGEMESTELDEQIGKEEAEEEEKIAARKQAEQQAARTGAQSSAKKPSGSGRRKHK